MNLRRMVIAFLAMAAVHAGAAEPPASIGDPPKVDLRALIVFVGEKFKKDFVIDPRIRGSVVDLGGLTPDAMSYHAFLELLQANGFVAMPSGDVVTVVPSPQARYTASKIVEIADIDSAADPAEVITVVIPAGEINATQLSTVLRTFVSPWGAIIGSTDGKSITLVDTAANAKRIVRIIEKLTELR